MSLGNPGVQQTNRSIQSGFCGRAATAWTPAHRDAAFEPFRSPSKDTRVLPPIASVASSTLCRRRIPITYLDLGISSGFPSCLPSVHKDDLHHASSRPGSGVTNQSQTLCWSRTETDLCLCQRPMAVSPILTATAALTSVSPSKFHPCIPPTPVRPGDKPLKPDFSSFGVFLAQTHHRRPTASGRHGNAFIPGFHMQPTCPSRSLVPGMV